MLLKRKGKPVADFSSGFFCSKQEDEMFELGIFITEEMKRKGIKKSELVKRIGYSNLSKGLRKLDGCIKEGHPARLYHSKFTHCIGG